MSRPLRIEYPNAWYHIMNRGRRSEKIFNDRHDYKLFIELLKETIEKWNLRISAYCLMSNHFHILVQTPEGNISRCMRHINGIYTQKYNKRHNLDGQLFRGRYKAILVSEDSYLLQLVLYIHKNPIKAGLVDNLEDYEWSSHNGYLSISKEWDWLNKTFILSMVTKDKSCWIKEYRKFMIKEDDDKIINTIESKKWPSMIGPRDFIDRIKSKYYSQKTDDEIPQSIELVPEKELIIKTICNFYNVAEDDLFMTKRGQSNTPRNIAVYLTRRLRRDTLVQICEQFRMNKYSSVSSIIERMEEYIKSNKELRKDLDKIRDLINMSQEQT